MKLGPKRDLYGEMVTAARKHGLRIGLYYSYYEWNNPIYRGKKDVSGYRGCTTLNDEDGDGDSSEYVDDFMMPQIKELIDKYHPDYLCFDGEWDHGYPYWRSRQIVAYYYNQAAARGQEVIINDRFGGNKEGTSETRGVYGDFKHVEYFANVDRTKPWAMWRGFGNSYGYNRNEHPSNILSPREVVHTVIDSVSNNGNIEFNIGPKADGTISKSDLDRLAVMGEWLRVNGEAIYGAQPGVFKNLAWGRSTTDGNTVYLHVYAWPPDGILRLRALMTKVEKAYLLHDPRRVALHCTQKGAGHLSIDLSDCQPYKYASVIALESASPPVVSSRVFPDEGGRVVLTAQQATVSGSLRIERNDALSDDASGGQSDEAARYNIGFWTDCDAMAQWDIQLRANEEYEVTIEWACAPGNEGGTYNLSIGETTIRGRVASNTGAWQTYQVSDVGTITVGSNRSQTAILRSETIPAGKAMMNVRRLVLAPVK
jgi:alpha-L-fucosidase